MKKGEKGKIWKDRKGREKWKNSEGRKRKNLKKG